MVIKQPVSSLTPQWTVTPNTAGGEGRTRDHQAIYRFPPQQLYEIRQQANQVSMNPDLPLQTVWAYDGLIPGPTFVTRYDEPILMRNHNDLPLDNGGFGIAQVSTHLHNLHTPSESDGFPCDWFPRVLGGPDRWYDHHYPLVRAGFDSTHPPYGDPNETLGTLWYHDHRVEFTAQNVYKGAAGFFLIFSENHTGDTGDENTGFHLPSFPEYDIPLMLFDRVFDPKTGLLAFDLFNPDGILGDKFLVNGKIQPYFQVKPRRYRFRILNSGPSRFFECFLTDLDNLNAAIPFWHIGNDGNLLPKPIKVTSTRIGVAERMDVVIDFRPLAGRTVYLENRLEQKNGRGPTGKSLAAGQGDQLLKFIVDTAPVIDNSVDFETNPNVTFFALPDKTAAPRVTRTFRFDRTNGQWAINNILMGSDCSRSRFMVQKNSVERWILQNNSGGWQHPIHIHFEEFQILKRNGRAPSPVENSRKDVVRLQFNEQIELFFRFRDFTGRYPMHCHNVVHEDHAMMLRFDIEDAGDTTPKP